MTMSRLLLLVAAVASVALARLAYELPKEAEGILTAPLRETFSCEGRPYGYYADMDNNCEVFHICHPIADKVAHFSFVCGNQTVFNQKSLTCSHRENAVPCEESAALYDLVNSQFGFTTGQR